MIYFCDMSYMYIIVYIYMYNITLNFAIWKVEVFYIIVSNLELITMS